MRTGIKKITTKMKMLMLIMIPSGWELEPGRSVMLVKIMTSPMCTGVFVCAGGKPPCCTHCSAVLFLTHLPSVFFFFVCTD